MLRLACALLVAAALVLMYLFLAPSGASAIAFTFAGNPLVAAGTVLAVVWLVRKRKEGPG
jgi:hypothetical protein